MDKNQSKSFQQILRYQKKEDNTIKSKKSTNVKHKKMNSFKSSLEKLFRFKSKSEKSLKHEDLLVGIIPQTIYLSPQETVSLSRDTWYISKTQPKTKISKEPLRYSYSDFACRRSATFCMIDVKKLDNFTTNQLRSVSPPIHTFSPVKEEEYKNEKVGSLTYTKVPHSISMPSHLSKSHQNVTKCCQGDLDIIKPAKRTARKKGLFNCSLFRKRSNSHSKSSEKITDINSQRMQCGNQSKSLNRSGNNNSMSILSDRCLTLPNLKSSELDLTDISNKNQLLSMDLIKDYLNRSNSSLQSPVQRHSTDFCIINNSQQFSSSVNNSPHTSSNCKCDLKKLKTSKMGLCDSRIEESLCSSETFNSQLSASTDIVLPKCLQSTSPIKINNSAFDSICYKYSNASPASNENQSPSCVRQISAPVYNRQPQPSHHYLSPPPTNCAFEFWTRPSQEKIKACRRRLLDDKVGSKEALLRSLSPNNIKINEGNVIYDNPYHLHNISEQKSNNIPDSHISDSTSRDSTLHLNSCFNGPQYILRNPEYIYEYRNRKPTSPVIENRLSESPISIPKFQETGYQNCKNDYLIYNTDFTNDYTQPTTIQEILSHKEIIQTNSNIFLMEKNASDGSICGLKDNKSIHSSTELILTRTPTPPDSFAESSASSIYPAPKEFISDPNTNIIHSTKICGTVNLLYTSDNSEDENDAFSHLEIEPMPPIPPPRTDSVLRSLQAHITADTDKSKLEYDISEEFPPVFSGANIDRCDIEQYHKWLEKLPYKLSEFPNILQCRKSAVSASKISPLTENINYVTKKLDLATLKQLKQTRKSIKSWNISESSKPGEKTSIISHQTSKVNSYSMKKSYSYDQSLNNYEMKCIDECSPPSEINPQIPTIDVTLLKQYSHLYSLKPSPSQTPKPVEIESAALKFNRSKSIDFRNFVNNVSNTSIPILEKFIQKRKSVPNSNFLFEISMTNKISGKNTIDTDKVDRQEYKVYPML